MIRKGSFGFADWLKIGILGSTLIPFTIVVLLKHGNDNSYLVMTVTGLAIVAAAYFLSWATESLQTIVSQAFALAVLALIQVLPEYSFEVILAWKRQLQFAAATMTGSNRLLMGLGWPLVFFIAAFFSWKKKKKFTKIKLGSHQSVEVVFLLAATVYSFVLIIRRSITLIDSAVFIGIYIAYILTVLSLPPENSVDMAGSTSKKIINLHGWKKFGAISLLITFGFTVIFFGAEPFIESLKDVAVGIGVPQYQFIQWFAPFLSEFPESLTAFLWGATIVLASMGLANLISSKVNQWTLLIASIPIFYSLSIGRAGQIPLDNLQLNELLLTTAQTLYGSICLLGLNFRWRHALTLTTFFSIQFLIPETRVAITYIYLALALVELILQRNEIVLFSSFGKAVRWRRENRANKNIKARLKVRTW